ncbi:MAG: DinB family protein [Planctomycetaceae bacterium]|nr:DinB family protein [Planctomycetaceae bacterium]
MRPTADEYALFYAGYVEQVPENDIVRVLESQLAEVVQLWKSIPESEAAVIHKPYSWKIRQVLDHLTDGERIFGYRLLRIARGDQTPLPGFDEHFYANASEESAARLSDIVGAFEALRRANVLLLKNLPDDAWRRMGTMSETPVSVRALAYILAGHVRHHDAILRKRLCH